AEADDARPGRHGGQRPVEEAAAIAEPVAGGIEADDRGEHDIRQNEVPLCRDRDVPDAARQRIARLPEADFQRPALFAPARQRPPPAASCALGKQRPQVRLAAEGPVGADDKSLDIADLGDDARGDRLTLARARLGRYGEALGDQAFALAPAPALDIRPGLPVE